MYLAYFDLKEPPFKITPDPRFIYLTTQHQEVLAKCQYAIAEKMGLTAIHGSMGSGKTSLARRLWEQYAVQPDATFALLTHPNYPTPFQFLQAVLREYGLTKPRRSLQDMVAYFDDLIAFRFHVAGGKQLPFTDDALEGVFRYSQGYPRRICRLCDNALIRAFSNGLHTIDGALIQSVAEEIHLTEPTEPSRQKAGCKPRGIAVAEEKEYA
jgi:type II secretory pathway predicted ATPase ExeA